MRLLTTLFIATALLSPAFAQAPASKAAKPPVRTDAMKLAKAAETWGEIIADREALAEAIKQNQLSEVHDLVFAIRDNVVTLPYKSDALPAGKRKILPNYAGTLSNVATELDRVADAGDLAKTKVWFARLNKVLDTIADLYPPNVLPSTGAKPLTAADRALFLTPGGAYTAEDIKANGNTSVYQKYAGFVAAHDAKPQSGDKICPISETKANPKLTWIIGGKSYAFCCPPCVAEFVAKVKKDPKAAKDPATYVKK